jgi:hypothetical protein
MRSVLARTWIGAIVLILPAWSVQAWSSFGETVPIDPAIYRSPSGRFVLQVVPSHRKGKGPADYRLIEDGAVRWEAEQPFTLIDAAVGDAGVVAGIAYDDGRDNFVKPFGNLIVAAIDSSGRIRFEHRFPRSANRFGGGIGEPFGRGLWIDAEHDRVVFRLSGKQYFQELWASYRLSTGERLTPIDPGALMPKPTGLRWINDVRPIPSTPLTLVVWKQGSGENYDIRHVLVDEEGRPVTSVDWTDRWDTKGANGLVAEYAHDKGTLLSVAASRFTSLRVESSEAVSFLVTQREKGWTVTESGRKPFVPPAHEPELFSDLRSTTARYLGSIALRHRTHDTALRDIEQFDVDDQGRFGFLRRDPDATRFLLVTDRGEVVREAAMPTPPASEQSIYFSTWLGQSRWLLVWTRPRPGLSRGFWFDAESGNLSEAFELPGDQAKAVAGRRDGGFFALVKPSTDESTGAELGGPQLASFTPDGRVSWRLPDGLNAAGLAATAAGWAGVVGPNPGTVQVFDGEGKRRALVDVDRALGQHFGYPTRISSDGTDGFLLEDWNNVFALSSDGRASRKFRPRYTDGRQINRLRSLRVDAQGRLWATDETALLRLNGTGVVDKVVGALPVSGELAEAASVRLDAEDDILAIDSRTGSVHVFSRDGNWERVLAVAPGDATGSLTGLEATVASDGRLCLSTNSICFAADGRRIPLGDWPVPIQRGASSGRSRDWWYQPSTGRAWVEDWAAVELIDKDGRLLRRIDKRFNKTWLREGIDVIPSFDGSAAILHGGAILQKMGWSLDVVDEAGEGLTSLDVPRGVSRYFVAFDGRLIGAWRGEEAVIFDFRRAIGARFTPAIEGRPLKDMPVYFADGGREIWFFERAAQAIHRFATPTLN